MDIFKIEPGLFIWTWISFGLLFLIMSKFVFPVLVKGLKEREKKIAKSVDNALAVEDRLKKMDDEYRQIIANANKKADEILRKTRTDAEELRKQHLEKAELEAQAILENARKNIEEERVKLVSTLREEIAEFVCDTSERLVDRSFTGEEEKQWALEMAEKL